MSSSHLLTLAFLLGCAAEEGRGKGSVSSDGDEPDTDACAGTLLPLTEADPALAAEGQRLLEQDALAGALFPEMALDYLWLAWGTGPQSRTQVLEEMRPRYGLHQAPWTDSDLPAGLREMDGGLVGFDCLLCHSDTIAGQPVLGAGNSTLDLDLLLGDLARLADLAESQGIEVPFEPLLPTSGWTGAPGANDAFGMAMTASLAYGPASDIETEYGFQQPAAWWTRAYKTRVYSDGAGTADNHRTMSAMSLAFGLSWAGLQAQDEALMAMAEAMRAMRPPPWPFETPDPEAVSRGQAIYETSCASCHRPLCEDETDARRVPLDEVGTDPARAEAFGESEATWVNASWFGADHPMDATDAYVAQPLVGVWATAPYFHNGSVPTLWGVLDSDSRPTLWRRTGTGEDDYDPEQVGWTVEELSEMPASAGEARKVHDTRAPGLDNGGHRFGDVLTDEERRDLIAFLKTL